MTDSGSPPCVLVVDDEELIRRTACMMLERRGFASASAANGEEAIDLVRNQPDGIDVVLLDHSMPGLSGVETLRALRGLAPDLPALIITGFPDDAGVYADADGVLQKPFSLDGLVTAVQALLDR